MSNKDNLYNQQSEYVDPVITQERLIDELLYSKEKLQKMIIDDEEIKKEKSLNWLIPLLGWNGIFSLVVGILIGTLVSFGILPSNVTLPIFGKIPTFLVSLVGINVLASLGVIEDIDFNYRRFYSKLEDQEVNIKKLKIIENKIKIEQKYLEKLKQDRQNISIEMEVSGQNELARLKLLKEYLLRYITCQYVPKSLLHEKDILKCSVEMKENYPYSSFDKKQKELEEVKTLLKKCKY